MRPSPRSLCLDLLSTLRRGAMPVRALVEAGSLFGIEANALRVALARLLAEGAVERDERGLYHLGAAADAVGRRIASWRDPALRMRSWNGGWIGVHGVRRAGTGRAARRRGAHALHLLGFRALTDDLALRPDNLTGGVEGARAMLAGLGLDPAALVFEIRALDPATDARARNLWDLAALRRATRAARVGVERSARRLPRLASREAMVESFLVGGRAIRQLNLDPLLPAEIGPPGERDALVLATRDYDRLGRAAWAGFLRAHGVPHARGAVDLRTGEAAAGLNLAGRAA